MTSTSFATQRHSRLGRIIQQVPVLATVSAILLAYTALILHGAEGFILTSFFALIFLGLAFIGRFATWDFRLALTPFLFMAIIWAWYLLSGTAVQELAIFELATLLGAAAIWLLVTSAGSKNEWRELVSHTFVICGLLYTIWTFSTYISSLQHVSQSGTSGSENPGMYLTASFGTHDSAAMVFDLLLLLSASHILQVWKRHYWSASSRWTILSNILRYGLFAFLLLLFSLSCLLMTGSRSGILIGLAGLTGLGLMEFLFWPGHVHTRLRGILFKLLVPLGALITTVIIWLDRFFADNPVATISGTEPTTGWSEMLAYLQLQLGLWMQAPVFGHGAGSFALVESAAANEQTASVIFSPQALDNILMRGLIETGLLGVGISVLIIAGIVRTLLRFISRSEASCTHALFALAVIWIWIMHGLIDTSVTIAGLLWLITAFVGLAFGQAHPDTNDTNDTDI